VAASVGIDLSSRFDPAWEPKLDELAISNAVVLMGSDNAKLDKEDSYE